MAEGQFVGKKSAYLYTADSGEKYLLLLDNTLATVAGSGLVLATTTNSAGASPKPLRFKPRGVFWQSAVAATPGRKFLICGDNAADLYATEVSSALTIDGIAGFTTGRRGETLSYLRLSSAA